MGALGWLLNLEFRGGLHVDTEPPAVQAFQTGRRNRPLIETSKPRIQALVQRHRAPLVIETEIRKLTDEDITDPTPPTNYTDEWTHIILDADFDTPAINAVAFPANYYATGLLWTPEPSKKYWFKCHLLLTYTGTVSTEPGFTWPTNLTEHAITLECAGATQITTFASATWGQNDENAAAPFADPLSVQLAGAHTPGALSHAVGEGYLETSSLTTGSLEVRINRAAAGGAATVHTLKAGSWLAWQELP